MSEGLSLDPNALAQRDRYKLLISLVIPRPIALVTTRGPTGVVNAAPFSFFNMFSESPPLCVLGLQCRHDGGLKDTSSHIRDRGAFVVNLVDEALGAQMNTCAIDFPPEISEIDAAKLTLKPSQKVGCVDREAPAAPSAVTTLRSRSAAARPPDRRGGAVHVRPVGQEKVRINIEHYRPLARLYGNFYALLSEPFTTSARVKDGSGAGEVTLSPLVPRSEDSSCKSTGCPLPRDEANMSSNNRPERHRHAAWVGSITGMPSASSSGAVRPCRHQPSDRVGAVLILSARRSDHARQRCSFADSATDNSAAARPQPSVSPSAR
jgi:hypothetical protein